jgi:CDP-diacylglycerol--glycerol-3-phosphate 3-phosphatidyltransferase
LVHSDVVIAFSHGLSAVVGIQLIWWVVNLAKYGQPASYHTYSAKAWGVSLFVATIALFGFGYGGLTLSLAIAVGIIHTVEEIAMTLILPQWTHDVLSIVHALSTAPILLKRRRCC